MIPFQNIDPQYLRQLDDAANTVREAVKNLKLLIIANEDQSSPAIEWATARHGEWKAVCSLTTKSIRAAKQAALSETAVSR